MTPRGSGRVGRLAGGPLRRDQRGVNAPLLGKGAALDHAGRGVGLGTRVEKPPAHLAQRGHRHEEDVRAARPHKSVKVDVQLAVSLAMPGEDMKRCRIPAAGCRDARIGERRERARDAWYHLEGHPRLGKRRGLLVATAKDVGVAALEPHDERRARAPVRNEHPKTIFAQP